MRKNVHCRSLSTIHMIYDQALVGGLSDSSDPARWSPNIQLDGGSKNPVPGPTAAVAARMASMCRAVAGRAAAPHPGPAAYHGHPHLHPHYFFLHRRRCCHRHHPQLLAPSHACAFFCMAPRSNGICTRSNVLAARRPAICSFPFLYLSGCLLLMSCSSGGCKCGARLYLLGLYRMITAVSHAPCIFCVLLHSLTD